MTWTNERNGELLERARKVIPGGMYGHHSTAMLPDVFPQFFSRAEGTRLWDADGNAYIDYACAFGPNLFGYRHARIEAAARHQAEFGDTMTAPAPVMIDLAEQFVAMVTHADWAMFCKNGSDATSMAMMVARAYSRRRTILVAEGAYHGSSMWSTPRLAGTLPEDRAHIVTYRYNDAESLEAAFRKRRGDIAGVFASPFKHDAFRDQSLPDPNYAMAARRLCDAEDSLLIIDDVRAGFRIARDCSWSTIGVQPDLSAWGKVLANGHPISALVGSERLRTAAQSIYVTGSYWFSAVPMAAAVATLREVRETDYLERIIDFGQKLRDGLHEQAVTFGFDLRQTGPVQMPQILFADDRDLRLGCAWVAAVLRRGVYLHPFHNMFLNAAMTEADLALTLDATEQAFRELQTRRSTLGANENELLRSVLLALA
jgi:glutamate-1-semialdehyde 2,1-aminomutase